MQGKRVLRYVGNREIPEEELFGAEEILHDWDKFLNLIDLKGMALTVNGLNDIKPLTFDEMSKMTQLVEPVTLPTLGDIWTSIAKEIEKPKPPEPEFEVNMVEPLVGWRSWRMHNGLLTSLHSGYRWFPEEVFKAAHKGTPHKEVPKEHCTCGIYAVDDPLQIPGGDVYGEVYGWGRYVRGDKGWRSEFAYPKSFLLNQDQTNLIDDLKKYHVPIHILAPTKVYSPEEDGYDEYRPNEAHGDSGTAQEPGADEDDYQDDKD